MKSLLFFVFVCLSGRVFGVGNSGADMVFADEKKVVAGCVKGTNGISVEYATVVFSKDGTYVAGATTDGEGVFSVELAAGEYDMEVSYVGYKSSVGRVVVKDAIDLGDVVLHPEAMEVDEVVVQGRMVTQRPDGYSLSLGDSKVAEGRNLREALKYVPGVWIDNNDQITVNGQGGVMVMINDRVMTMSSTDLLNYLESINAEDVKSIDVVRSAGAKYDASASGAVLKINLRNRSKVEGVFGTVSMNYRRTDTLTTLVMPSVWVNAMYGKLSLSTGFTYARRQYSQFLRQYSCFRQLGDTINSESVLNNGQHSYNYTLRGVYNIDERNSVGVDYDFRRSPSDEDNLSSSVGYGRSYGDLMNYATTKSLSPSDLSKTHDLSVNYRRTLDSLGSDLLLVADYHRSNSRETDISELMQQLGAVKVFDYVKSASMLKNDFYTARIDVTKRFNTKWSLSYGAKYSYSKMSSVFEYYSSGQGTEWVYDDVYSDDYRYREGIAAAYASATGRVGRLNIMAGLRVENTDLRPTSLKQSENHHNNYTDFFPSASLSYLLTAKGDYVAAMSYRRSIRRPGFAMLNPRRQPIDNISVAVGNPYLKPSYSNNVSLNFTLAGRYMLTAAYEGDKDLFAQVAVIDENNPEIVMYKNDNIDKQDILIFNAYLPFNPFKWWNFNISGGSGLMQSTFMGRERSKWFYRGMANMTFLLPKKWIVEMSGWCAGNMIQGNIVVDRPVASMDASVKKTFLDGKLTLMAEVKGIVYTKTSMLIDEPSYRKRIFSWQSAGSRSYGISLKYNFKTGKDFRAAQVVKGNAEDASRF